MGAAVGRHRRGAGFCCNDSHPGFWCPAPRRTCAILCPLLPDSLTPARAAGALPASLLRKITLHRLWAHARRQLRQWSFGTLMLLCTNAAVLSIPPLHKRATDGLQHGAPASSLVHIALVMASIAAINVIFRTLSRIAILNAARDVELSLRTEFYVALTAQGPDFFARHPTGDLMSRATNDLTQVRLMLGPGLLNVVNALVRYGFAVPLMAGIDGRLTLIAFVVYPPAVVLMRRLGRALYKKNRTQQASLGALSNVVQENLAANALVRAFAVESEQTRKFESRNRAYLQDNLALAWLRSGMFRVSASVSGVGMLLVAFLGALEVRKGRLTLGDVVALVEYMALLSEPAFALGWVLSLWQRGLASMNRLDEVLRVQATVRGGERTRSDRDVPEIEALGLTVDHGDGRGVFDVDFLLRPGQTLGIVGAIGSGKSTLLRAMLRLVPHAGALCLDGTDSRELTLDALRATFGYVPQNPTLLSKSIAENIAFGAPGARSEEVEQALRVAAMLEEARALPEGLDTQIGERGVTLSGGQKQRCAIARALLRDSPVLVLDDALSAVDTATEARILAALQARNATQSTVVVAHRLTSVRHADVILVLKNGRVVERGNHADLIAQDGLYAEMASRQRSSVPEASGTAVPTAAEASST